MVKMTTTGTVLIKNECVRVTRWDFPNQGDCTGWHRHGYDYVMVSLFDGDLRIDQGDDVVTSSLTTGGSYFRKAGLEYNVCNANSFACIFVKVELLEPNLSMTYCIDSPARMMAVMRENTMVIFLFIHPSARTVRLRMTPVATIIASNAA